MRLDDIERKTYCCVISGGFGKVIRRYEGHFEFEICDLQTYYTIEKFLTSFFTKKSAQSSLIFAFLLLLLDCFGDTIGSSLFILQLYWCDWVE